MKKNQINKDGEQHGPWEYYHYYNGQLWYKGNLNNGKKHDLWEFYYSNGKLMSKTNYKHGKHNGYCEDYGYYRDNHTNKTLTKKFHI